MTGRAIIVGGGVIGLSLAWELARRQFRVTLLERDKVGQATSWAGVGILPPANLATATDPIDRLRGLSHQLYPEWTKELHRTTEIDPGFRRCGGWYLANTPGENAAMIGMTHYWGEMQIQCEPTSWEEVARREPSLASWTTANRTAGCDTTAAWWTPDECQVRSPDLLAALQKACDQSGVRTVEDFAVTDIVDDHGTISVTGQGDTDDMCFQGDVGVVCAGAWTGIIASRLKLNESVVPIRGQVLMFKSPKRLLNGIVNVGNRYLVSRDDGHTLVGSCEEEVGWRLGTTASVLDSLRAFALEMCPDLRRATEVRAWSGLRPMTFDGFPMIGRVPDANNLFVAAGHYRSGIHLAPATAKVIADSITETPSVIDLQPFSIGKKQSNNEKT